VRTGMADPSTMAFTMYGGADCRLSSGSRIHANRRHRGEPAGQVEEDRILKRRPEVL